MVDLTHDHTKAKQKQKTSTLLLLLTTISQIINKLIYFQSCQNKECKNPYVDHAGIQSLQSACIHTDILSGKLNNIREWGAAYTITEKRNQYLMACK